MGDVANLENNPSVAQLVGAEVYAQLTQLEGNNSIKQPQEVQEHGNQMTGGIMIESTNNFVGKVRDCQELCDVVLNSLQSS